jgi:hypothetical protein
MGMTIYGMKIYDIASAISQIDCNDWVKLQDVETIIAMVRAEYNNRECVWGEGECVPDCPSCRRIDEMLSERAVGDREGQQHMLSRCIAAVEEIENDLDSSAEWDRDYDVDPSGSTRNPRIWVREAIFALQSLEINK